MVDDMRVALAWAEYRRRLSLLLAWLRFDGRSENSDSGNVSDLEADVTGYT